MTRDSDAMLARKAAGFEPRSGRSAGLKGIAQKLKTLIGQYKLSKDVSLRRKLIGVEYEKRRLAGKKAWASRLRRQALVQAPNPQAVSALRASILDAVRA